MTVISLASRLAALEARTGTRRTAALEPNPLRSLLLVLIAFHLGGMEKDDAPVDGFARGLGYADRRDFDGALKADRDTPAFADLNTRWSDAVRRLFALEDAVPECDGWTFARTLERLFHALPERGRGHPLLKDRDGVPFFDFGPSDPLHAD